MEQSKLEKKGLNIYALFVYITLIVDFYRKFSANVIRMPVSVNMFRNILYIAMFAVILLTEKRVQQWIKLLMLTVAFAMLTAISWLININRGAGSEYINLIFMFISRLLPAYYIGTKIAGREAAFVNAVNKFQIFTVAYLALIITFPETSEESYLTISGNILIPALIGLLGAQKEKKSWIPRIIGLAGVAVILIYGGRTYLVAVVLAIAGILLIQLWGRQSVKRMLLFLAVIIVAVVLLFTYEDIVNYLYQQYPSSRTLKLLAKGEFFWSSNRDSYYKAAYASFLRNPLKIYGFLGDRFYYYDTFESIGGNAFAITMFSHNTLLELMLNFGVPIGLAIICYFIGKILAVVQVLKRRADWSATKLFIILFASAFAPLFLSSSWLNDYMIWLLVGAMLGLAAQKKISA